MFGWTENFSTQGPDDCHIEFCKNLAGVPTTKTFSWQSCAGPAVAHLQFLQVLESDMAEDDKDLHDGLAVQSDIRSEKNDGISCEICIGYPTLQSIMSGHSKNNLSIKVRTCYIACNITCYLACCRAGCIDLCSETAISNSLLSLSYKQRVIGHQSLEG